MTVHKVGGGQRTMAACEGCVSGGVWATGQVHASVQTVLCRRHMADIKKAGSSNQHGFEFATRNVGALKQWSGR